jgi:hypothetical protein
MDHVGLILDLVVATLLVATIVYATVLNRKLTALRDNKREMEALVNRLVESTAHAERGLADLKVAAGEKGEDLERRVKEARSLADDLSFLVDKGGSLADRLERQIGQARKATTKPAAVPADGPVAAHRTKSESWPGATAVKSAPAERAADPGPVPAPARRPARSAHGAAAANATAPTGAHGPAAAHGRAAAPNAEDPVRTAASPTPADSDPRTNKLLKALRGVR